MRFPSTPASASSLRPSPQQCRLLRILVVGPEFLANTLQTLLATIEDVDVLTPLSEPDQVLPFIERVSSTQHPLDVIVMYSSGDLEADHLLLRALTQAQQRCLIVTSLHFPNEVELIKQTGAWGLFFTTAPVHQFVSAVRIIAHGHTYFPESLPALPAWTMTSLGKPRQMVFHEERLKALAHQVMWTFKETELHILRHIADPSIQEIATKTHLRSITVRRELSQRVYQFLELIRGRPVPSRLVALQVLQEYGVIEYVLPPPST